MATKKKKTKVKAVATKRKVTAQFDGAVISLHVFFAGHEVPMSQNGTKWTGKCDQDVSGKVRAELVFKAPGGTNYAFVLNVGAAKKVEDSGTSGAPLFSRGYDVEV